MLRLVLERKRKKWTQFKLAAEANIHPAQLSRLETGRTLPYEPEKERLEKVFGIPAEQLFSEMEEDAKLYDGVRD